jgi:lysophospholipase L1-like esterase
VKKALIGVAVLIVLALGYAGWRLLEEATKAASDDPLVWEDAIAAFEAEDRESPPPKGAFLSVGSSSIRLWSSLAEDMAPLPVIRRGFGGARMHDVLHYADRIILPYGDTRAVVVFVGTNDVNVADSPEEAIAAVAVIRDGFTALVDRIHAARPTLPVFWIDITPSRFSWDKIAAVDAANAAVAEICAARPHVHCIATREAFLDGNGEPNEDLFRFDGLHLNGDGYARWTEIIKPRLLTLTERG